MADGPNAVSTAVSEDSLFIPLIDFSLFLNGSEEDKKAAAKGIIDGFTDAGFMQVELCYIKNHGISQNEVDHVFSESARFFQRPKDEKEALAWAGLPLPYTGAFVFGQRLRNTDNCTTPESNRGYVSHGREKVTQLSDHALVAALRSVNPDLKESFEIGRDNEPGHPNHWPQDPVFTSTMQHFFQACHHLHIEVMRAIGLGMGLEPGFFDAFTNVGDHTLRLLHYPAARTEVFAQNRGQVRAGRHTDYGSITLLFQDDKGGLQVKTPRGTFVNATPIPGTIVVNAGDLLARWSNDLVKSTEHQVVEPPRVEAIGDEYPPRYSCAYFCNPNFDAFIEALPGTYGTEAEKKYPGINSGEYLVQRLASTYV